ncbi:FAD-binding protein [Bradyrhizobium sp. LHD-71]|uniref:FAD-dependent oxidoreductase n=1 Tax=Bradyrhizobium sp. LHD-71 TaxID=3072141 RepID=UPI00280C88CC|nr:FAD-binding protein [Bradyrhizobium sp. LHD-71]MDQ8727349.1 FAD-dependent oxidoreductase [Bradyrhizobium sp. LHD-71]
MSDAQIDVLVVGAGACGLAAAITAHDRGVSTAIIEKRHVPGGNSSLSTGSVPAANSRLQREAGIVDSPDALVADLMNIAKETDDLALVRRLAEVSGGVVEWLIDDVGARMQLITAYKHIGHSVSRLHAPVSRVGQDLVDDLLGAVERRGIPLAVGNAAIDLLVENGAVKGAIVESSDGRFEMRAEKTILAVNGFAANNALIKRYCPEIAGADYFGAPGSTGEAVIWGEKLGADFANMAAYQGYAAVAYPHGSLLSWTTMEKGGILIDDSGSRFGDESLGYSGFAKHVLNHGRTTYAVFDQRIFDIATQEQEFRELDELGGIKKGKDAREFAAKLDVSPDAFEGELARYNQAAAGEAKDRFGRSNFGLAPLTGMLCGCQVKPGLFHTQGGLRVDADARVLRPDGKPIPNLFAGGGAAAGISGRAGALGYASGNGLLSAIALGRLAALAGADEIKGARK